jgi:hypothetical protein
MLWILDFLTDREQGVKLSQDCHSEWGKVPAGLPQCTKLGPWLFCIMINDLSVKDVNDLWKYVDDSSLSELVCSDGPSNLQKYVDEFQPEISSRWISDKGIKMQIDLYKLCTTHT